MRSHTPELTIENVFAVWANAKACDKPDLANQLKAFIKKSDELSANHIEPLLSLNIAEMSIKQINQILLYATHIASQRSWTPALRLFLKEALKQLPDKAEWPGRYVLKQNKDPFFTQFCFLLQAERDMQGEDVDITYPTEWYFPCDHLNLTEKITRQLSNEFHSVVDLFNFSLDVAEVHQNFVMDLLFNKIKTGSELSLVLDLVPEKERFCMLGIFTLKRPGVLQTLPGLAGIAFLLPEKDRAAFEELKTGTLLPSPEMLESVSHILDARSAYDDPTSQVEILKLDVIDEAEVKQPVAAKKRPVIHSTSVLAFAVFGFVLGVVLFAAVFTLLAFVAPPAAVMIAGALGLKLAAGGVCASLLFGAVSSIVAAVTTIIADVISAKLIKSAPSADADQTPHLGGSEGHMQRRLSADGNLEAPLPIVEERPRPDWSAMGKGEELPYDDIMAEVSDDSSADAEVSAIHDRVHAGCPPSASH